MPERVSVALCTHNGEEHLPEQLRSILAQTRPVDEIVLSDDASTDRTRAILEEFRAAAPAGTRVIVLHNGEPLGVTGNFEKAVRATSGDIVLLCDQDDVWAEDKVASLVRILDRQTPQVLIEARIVEASSTYSRDVGIQWGGDVAQSTQTGNPTGIRFPYNWSLAGGASSIRPVR